MDEQLPLNCILWKVPGMFGGLRWTRQTHWQLYKLCISRAQTATTVITQCGPKFNDVLNNNYRRLTAQVW